MIKQLAEKGIPFFAASGDNGSSDGEWGKHLDYPAESPYAIACGGTNLQLNADGSRLSETAWSNGGGGVSIAYARPDWQKSVGSQTGGRLVPDVAGNADPNTGYIVEVDGVTQQIGGTSAVAPLMAAFQAILHAQAGKHIGNMHTKIYSAPQCFYDVTEGSNGAYKAAKGFDNCTGMGVVNGEEFIKQFA